MNSQVWWFVARSSGIVAWALLTLSVCWGLLLSTRLLARRVSPAWLLDLHRHLGGMAVVFTGIHLVGLVADSYVTFGWAELFVPMASSWKPGAVAFGIVAFYLLLAIEITSLAIRRLPRSLWRWVHRSSFVLFGVATYHGVVAGTDAGNAWYRLATWVSVGVVTTLTLVLVAVARRSRTRFASFPPVAVPTSDDHGRSDSLQLTPPAPVPYASTPPPPPTTTTPPLTTTTSPPPPPPPPPLPPGSQPLAPAAGPMPMRTSTTPLGVGIPPLGSIEPIVPEAPPGPVVPLPPRRPPPAPLGPPRTGAPLQGGEAPISPWQAPVGAPVDPEQPDLATAGRFGAGAGEPPTGAT